MEQRDGQVWISELGERSRKKDLLIVFFDIDFYGFLFRGLKIREVQKILRVSA